MKKINRSGPDTSAIFPVDRIKSLCFIKNVVRKPNIIVGDYTYYDDPENPQDFERNVLYLYDMYGDKLIIGKFCAIAPRVKFFMNGANHKINAFTTYPFGLFGQGWEAGIPDIKDLTRGDTVIGNDVWIGYESLIMPGVKIGDGAIIAARSMVTEDVEPYTIAGGNPVRPIRKRFNDDVIELLQQLRWWDWDIEKITANIAILCSMDIDKLKALV
jgi:virginiamycin A acetyltransferase